MPTFVNPFQQIRCFYCDQLFYPGECAIVSSRTGKMLRDAKSSAGGRLILPSLEGAQYAREQALRQCPHCGKGLPRNFEQVKNHTIAIVGDLASGKTHYLTSCIQQLMQRGTWQVIGCSKIVGQGDSDTRYYKDYYAPVYVRHEQFSLTPQGALSTPNALYTIDPLIYEVVFAARSRLQPAKSVNLMFYDSSGEDIAQEQRMILFSHYILRASAIIFLADPLAMHSLVDKLPHNHSMLPGTDRRFSPSTVLNRVIQTFEQNLGLKPGAKLQTPIAIAVSKSDLLEYVTSYTTTKPLFLSDTTLGNKLDPIIFGTIDREVRDLLQHVGDKELLPSTSSFVNTSFFAVSPTGWPADQTGKFPRIEPRRCLDPLLWALWKLRVIENE